MTDMFTLQLPTDADIDLVEMEAEVRSIDGVDGAGTLGARSIDPSSIGMWIQLAGTGIGVVAAAVPVIDKILGLLRKKEIKGAKLKFEGGELELDGVAVGDLERLLAAAGAGKKAGG